MITQVGTTPVLVDDGTVRWTSGLAVDADGSPRAYAPIGAAMRGLDYLANAGHGDRWIDPDGKIVVDAGVLGRLNRGNAPIGYRFEKSTWWGLVCDSQGNPIVQDRDCPAPGFYISKTALFDAGMHETNPRRFVDSEIVPFIVIPRDLLHVGVKLGDLAVVFYKGIRVGAICADGGPAGEIGEGSIALAEALGINSDPRKGGVNKGVTYVVMLGSASTPPWPRGGNISALALAYAEAHDVA